MAVHSSSNVPFRRDQDFVGQKTILAQIQEKCSKLGSWTALVGPGGVGKSHLAIEYTYQIREKSPDTWVFWLRASNATWFEQSFRDIADSVKISGWENLKINVLEVVHDWLRDSSQPWVIVLDDLDDAHFMNEPQLNGKDQDGQAENARKLLRDYIPRCEKGSILITTRNEEAMSGLVESKNMIHVAPMDKSQAIVLFDRKLGMLHDKTGIQELVDMLQYMPIAIVQAAAYISQKGTEYSVQQYIQEYRRTNSRETDADTFPKNGEKNPIYTTWEISFDHVRQTRPSAADVLSVMSFFDRKQIPLCLLLTEQENEQRRKAQNDTKTANKGQKKLPHLKTADDILILQDYSFISIIGDGTLVEMHRLVQLATQRWLDSNDLLEKWKMQSIQNLNTYFPQAEFENWAVCRMLFPHAKLAARHKPLRDSSSVKWPDVLLRAAQYSWKMGNLADAEDLATKSMEVWRKELGHEDYKTLVSMGMLGMAYESSGRWDEAAVLHEQVYEIRKRIFGPDDSETLASMHNLAASYSHRGQWAKAEEFAAKVVDGRKRILGPEHRDTLISINQLAIIYNDQGKYDKTEKMEEELVETDQRVLGPEHPDTLSSMHNLAVTYRNTKKYDKAVELHSKVLESERQIFGPESPKMLLGMSQLAVTYTEQGQHDKAEQLQSQVVTASKRVLGQEHPNTLTSMHNLAYTNWRQGKETKELLEQVVEVRKRVIGPEHPDTLTSMVLLATVWKQQEGRGVEAIQLLEEGVRLCRKVLDPAHPYIASFQAGLDEWHATKIDTRDRQNVGEI